ncbi:response regulator transcription factor (plasmid) [Coraliomargarita sp. W4R53]
MAAILVVEDEADVARLIQLKLSSVGHDVEVASDGQFGLEAAAASLPDLVIVDWMMPRKNGLEVCAALRADERYVKTRILMVSARAQESDRLQALAAGADDYVTKPFLPRELAQRVATLIASAA